MQRSCISCGVEFTPTTPSQRRCPTHQGSGTGWSHNRDRRKQAEFRQALLARAGRRCEWVERGRRCDETEDLRACHILPLVEGGDYTLDNGRLLCRTHDRQTDRHAR